MTQRAALTIDHCARPVTLLVQCGTATLAGGLLISGTIFFARSAPHPAPAPTWTYRFVFGGERWLHWAPLVVLRCVGPKHVGSRNGIAVG